jgi:hypothetical protein
MARRNRNGERVRNVKTGRTGRAHAVEVSGQVTVFYDDGSSRFPESTHADDLERLSDGRPFTDGFEVIDLSHLRSLIAKFSWRRRRSTEGQG